MKESAKQTRIWLWIRSNSFKYATSCATQSEFGRILSAVRKHILESCQRQGQSWGIKIDDLGTILIEKREQPSIRMLPCKQIMTSFKCEQQQKNILHEKDAKIHSNTINFIEVSGKLHMECSKIQNVWKCYLSAGLDIARNDPDRTVELQLGVAKIAIHQSKITLKLFPERINKKEDKKLFPNLTALIEMVPPRVQDRKAFEESLKGCLQGGTNIRQIKNNLDAGQALTKRYLKYEQNFPDLC